MDDLTDTLAASVALKLLTFAIRLAQANRSWLELASVYRHRSQLTHRQHQIRTAREKQLFFEVPIRAWTIKLAHDDCDEGLRTGPFAKMR
jgi:hypothetical protein